MSKWSNKKYIRIHNPIRGNKYKAVKKVYNGHTYASQKEAEYAFELDMRKVAKEIKGWEKQVKISMDVNGKHICNYYIDFVITHNDGSKEYVEIKGFKTAVWKLKWKLFEAIYPDYKKTIIE